MNVGLLPPTAASLNDKLGIIKHQRYYFQKEINIAKLYKGRVFIKIKRSYYYVHLDNKEINHCHMINSQLILLFRIDPGDVVD